MKKVVRTEERSLLCTHEEADIHNNHLWKYGWRLGCRVEITQDLLALILYTLIGLKRLQISSPKKLEKNVQAQIAFGHLGQLDNDQSNDFTEIEKFASKNVRQEKFEKNSWC